MASEAGKQRSNVELEMEALQKSVRAYDFVSTIRKADCLFCDNNKLGDSSRIANETIRLSQHIKLGFSGCALESLQPYNGKHQYRLYVNFMGLLGTNGPMPIHYTEYADQRFRHHRDPSFAEFIDLFNHRFLSHFYRAIAIFDPAINMDRTENNEFDLMIGALAGIAPRSAKNRDSLNDFVKKYHSSWFGNSTKTPDGIKAIIKDYYGFNASIKEFVGGWLSLPEQDRAVLGNEGIRLGSNLYIGQRVWSVSHKFQLTIEPLNWIDYMSFRPGGMRCNELYELIRNYIGDEWDWDLELIVRESQVKPLQLNRSSNLGFNSWLTGTQTSSLNQQSVVINKTLLH